MPTKRTVNPYYRDPNLGAAFNSLASMLGGDDGAGLSRDALNYAGARAKDADTFKTQGEAVRADGAERARVELGDRLSQALVRQEPTLVGGDIASPEPARAESNRPATTEEIRASLPGMMRAGVSAYPEKPGGWADSLAPLLAMSGDDTMQRQSLVMKGHQPGKDFAGTAGRADSISARDAAEAYSQAVRTAQIASDGARQRELDKGVDVGEGNTRLFSPSSPYYKQVGPKVEGRPTESTVKAGIIGDLAAGKAVPEPAMRAVGGARNSGSPVALTMRAAAMAEKEAKAYTFRDATEREAFIEARVARLLEQPGTLASATGPAAGPGPGGDQPAAIPAQATVPGPTPRIPGAGPQLKGDLSVNESRTQRDIAAAADPLLADIAAVLPRLSVMNTGVAGAGQRAWNATVGAVTGANANAEDTKTIAMLAGIKTRVQGMLKVDNNMSAAERGDLERLAETIDVTKGLDQVKSQLQEVARLATNRKNVAMQRLGRPATPLEVPGGSSGASAAPPSTPGSVPIPPRAVEALRADPSLASQFEQKYGAGSAALALGQ